MIGSPVTAVGKVKMVKIGREGHTIQTVLISEDNNKTIAITTVRDRQEAMTAAMTGIIAIIVRDPVTAITLMVMAATTIAVIIAPITEMGIMNVLNVLMIITIRQTTLKIRV
jgi:hypothetical protein